MEMHIVKCKNVYNKSFILIQTLKIAIIPKQFRWSLYTNVRLPEKSHLHVGPIASYLIITVF